MVLLQVYVLLYMAAKVSGEISETYKLEWVPILPLIFNQDVILECKIPNCCTNTTKWIGGPNGTLLTYQKHSLNDKKYKEIWGRNENYLVIKNFGVNDANSIYVCYHGFDYYGQKLTMGGNSYELLPTEATMNKAVTISGDHLHVWIEFLEVYPMPDCRIYFQNEDISNYSRTEEIVHEYFYRVNYFLRYVACVAECNETLKLTCAIGTHNMTLLESYLVVKSESNYLQLYYACRNSVLLPVACLLIWTATVFLLGYINIHGWSKSEYSQNHERIKSSRKILLVSSGSSLILFVFIVVDIYIGQNCTKTDHYKKDSKNETVAIVVLLLTMCLLTLLLHMVFAILLFRKITSNKQDNNKHFFHECLVYWCCRCRCTLKKEEHRQCEVETEVKILMPEMEVSPQLPTQPLQWKV